MCKLNHDGYETFKSFLTHPNPIFRNSSDFEIICDAIFGTQGELEPQFASKESYVEKNIKKICRSNLGVIKHLWTSYLSSNISHVPSKKIWEYLGQFGGLDIKTS